MILLIVGIFLLMILVVNIVLNLVDVLKNMLKRNEIMPHKEDVNSFNSCY